MRIIAGTWRGRKLLGPIGTRTRPVLDRVKGAIFDILGSRLGLPGQLPPISVLDLFSGTGSMGLEALSRGVRDCHFVDQDRSALKQLRQNIENLGAGDCASVSAGSAMTIPLAAGGRYDLVFVDPPYRQSADISPAGMVPRLFRRLADDDAVSEAVMVVCRHDHKVTLPEEMAGFVQFDRRRYRQMAVTFYERPGRVDCSAESA